MRKTAEHWLDDDEDWDDEEEEDEHVEDLEVEGPSYAAVFTGILKANGDPILRHPWPGCASIGCS